MRSGAGLRKVPGVVPKQLSHFEEGMTFLVLWAATGYNEV